MGIDAGRCGPPLWSEYWRNGVWVCGRKPAREGYPCAEETGSLGGDRACSGYETEVVGYTEEGIEVADSANADWVWNPGCGCVIGTFMGGGEPTNKVLAMGVRYGREECDD